MKWVYILAPFPSALIAAFAFLPYNWAHMTAGALSAGFAVLSGYYIRKTVKAGLIPPPNPPEVPPPPVGPTTAADGTQTW